MVKSRTGWINPMRARSPDEPHRGATPLELFFDLVFVVAVAQSASFLHHGILEGDFIGSVGSYAVVFFAIWLAWMNFTLFASTFDNGDVLYRLLVFVQMTGALIIASGVKSLFVDNDFTNTVIGYVVMRIAHITQYLRVASDDPDHRPAALRHVVGIGVAQIGWVIFLFLPAQLRFIGFLLGVCVELLIPIWAEMASPTLWHPEHIRERFGLFTIIVLGESVLSTSRAIQSALDTGAVIGELGMIIVGGLLIVYSMWWLYFYQPADSLVVSLRHAFIWGYSHLFIFGSTAAVGAGLAVVIDQLTHHAEISATSAGMAVALPIAIYVLCLWLLHDRSQTIKLFDKWLHPVVVLLILLSPLTGNTVLVSGSLLVLLVAIRLKHHLE